MTQIKVEVKVIVWHRVGHLLRLGDQTVHDAVVNDVVRLQCVAVVTEILSVENETDQFVVCQFWCKMGSEKFNRFIITALSILPYYLIYLSVCLFIYIELYLSINYPYYAKYFYQAAIAVKISNLLICFCSFDLSCPILFILSCLIK